MTLDKIERTKRDAMAARTRFEATLAAVQQRLRPGNLAEEAWDGVKEKGVDLADGALQAVRKRPGTVSVALGAFALFLARGPLARAVGRYISSEKIAGDGADGGNDRDGAELSVAEGVR